MPDLNADVLLNSMMNSVPNLDQEWVLPGPISSTKKSWELIEIMPKIDSVFKTPTNFSLEIDWQGQGASKGTVRVVLARGSLMAGYVDLAQAEFFVSPQRNTDLFQWSDIEQRDFFEKI